MRSRIWRYPIVLALLSTTGLATALFSDGWGDVVAWLCLGLVCTVALAALAKSYLLPRR